MRKSNKIFDHYFDWMYDLVCDKKYMNISYKKLFEFLNNVEFTYTIPKDRNRAIDGVDFRYRFGCENGYSRETIDHYFGDRPCSVLEMMVALAFRIEEQIMDDPDYGNRTGQWFWHMVVNLGLGNMCDNRFDSGFVETVIARFLHHEYAPDGTNGLFKVSNPIDDMRDTEIWWQAMWYLNEFLED